MGGTGVGKYVRRGRFYIGPEGIRTAGRGRPALQGLLHWTVEDAGPYAAYRKLP